MSLSRATRTLLASLLFITLLPLLGLSKISLDEQRVQLLSSPTGTCTLPPAGLLKALTFGFNELAADLVWIRTIAYFVDQLLLARDFRYLHRYLEAVYELDPHFHSLYRYGSAMVASLMQRITNADTLYAIDLLKRGHKVFPDDWKIAWSIGVQYMFELKPASAEEGRRFKRMGADWIRLASLLGSDIPWLPSLVAQVYSEQGHRDLAIRHLRELYLVSQDEKMKSDIRMKLRQLDAERQVSDLKDQTAEMEQEYRTSPLGFLPIDLYLLVRQEALGPYARD